MENQMPHNCNLAAHQQATKQRAATRESCSAARALEIVGERWSLLVVRDAIFRRTTRFSEFLGIAPNILASRVDGFVEAGLMEARRYSDQHDHSELCAHQENFGPSESRAGRSRITEPPEQQRKATRSEAAARL
jgi:DNA-binding HxlR family transcriptional regulator